LALKQRRIRKTAYGRVTVYYTLVSNMRTFPALSGADCTLMISQYAIKHRAG
jgi:hypothetical protein